MNPAVQRKSRRKADHVPAPLASTEKLETAQERPVVRCRQCELRQFLAPHCRRCSGPLSPPDVVREVVQVDSFGGSAPVLPMAEYEKLAIQHAIRSTQSVIQAAESLRIGKATIYRKMEVLNLFVRNGLLIEEEPRV